MHESVLANAVRECLWDSYNWVLLAALASCGALLLVLRLRRVYGVNAASTLLLYSYNFGNCLTIAIVFYLGDPRYIITQETFTLFAEFAGVVMTMHTVFAFFRHRLLLMKRPGPATREFEEQLQGARDCHELRRDSRSPFA
jgi:hypothetical protein